MPAKAAPIVPRYNWPSPPILIRPIRNATDAANPVNAYGVAEISVRLNASVEAKPRSRMRMYTEMGFLPVAISTTAPKMRAPRSESRGTPQFNHFG